MDRLLLPDLLGEVDRVVYVDVDTLLLDDICELAWTDLGGRPVAARHTKVTEAREWPASVTAFSRSGVKCRPAVGAATAPGAAA